MKHIEEVSYDSRKKDKKYVNGLNIDVIRKICHKIMSNLDPPGRD